MDTERIQPAASVENLDKRTEGSPDYDTLLRRYGEAMLRISYLESMLADLEKGQPENSRGDDSSNSTPGLQNLENSYLLSRVQELEKRLSADPQNSYKSDLAYQGRRLPGPTHDMDVAQLKLQVTSLANQLAQTEDELKRVKGTRVRSRSHGKHRSQPKWKFWRGSRGR